MLTLNTSPTNLAWGVSTATPRFLATLLTATSHILRKNASLGASFCPPRAPVRISWAAFFSFLKWAGKSAPREDKTLEAEAWFIFSH